MIGAGAVTALLAGCGGGGGGGGTPTASASLQVAGTAATGAAMADAAVEVKCAAGTGTGSTTANGSYSVSITGGALPCLIEAKTTVGGVTRTLHSVVDAGTLDASGNMQARANITPFTEMIVAQAGAALPEQSFRAFTAGSITAAQVQAAAAAVVAALKEAGIDLGGIDPLKSELVAGTSAGQGNAYDQLLDALAARLDRDALTVVTNQIAVAAQAGSTAGLKNAMAAVAGGTLPGCSSAVSGSYRSLDMYGNFTTRVFDFAALRMTTPGTSDALSLTADSANACVFTASGTLAGVATTMKIVIGANGVGTYRASERPNTAGVTGYLFPAQSFAYDALRGTWSNLNNDLAAKEQILGQITFGDGKKVTSCGYDGNANCVADPLSPVAVENGDGGFTLPVNSTETVTVYGYRAPNGAFALFGGSNPDSGASQTHVALVASKLSTLAVPAVDTVTTSWGTDLSISPSLTFVGTDPAPVSYTVTQSDASGLVTRRNNQTGRIETLHYNQPVAGLRSRDAGTAPDGSSFAALVQFPLTGMDVTVSINAVPFGANSTLIYDIAVVK